MNPRSFQTVLRRVMPPVLALLLVAAFAFFFFKRHYDAGRLSADSMDTLQAARYFARTGQFGTFVIRPLVSGFMPFRADGSQPDLGHAPLYTVVAGGAMRLLKQTGAGVGDQPAVLVSLAAWTASVGAVFLLARQLFGQSGVPALAGAFYALASGLGLTLSVTPHPATLAALWFPLLLLALTRLDKKQIETPLSVRAAVLWSLLAGGFAGLLWLSAYSTLVLTPILLWHIARVTGKTRGVIAIPVFLAAFFVVVSPCLWRNFQETRNPVFHSRSLELIMHTETNPGYELYRSATLGQSVGQFLSSGGYRQVAKKSLANLVSYGERLPGAFGVVLLPLYIGAGLIRFDDSRANRLRLVAYLCVAVHFAGLSLFQSASENIPLLLMHRGVGAVLAAGFLHALIRARNLPRFYERSAVAGWAAAVCVPGSLVYFGGYTALAPEPWAVFAAVNDSAKTVSARLGAVRAGNALLVSESPWEWAFRCDLPTVWLPRNAGDFADVATRAGRPVAAVVLTPTLVSDYANDSAATDWVTTYLRLGSLWSVSAPLDPALRKTLVGKVRLFYPASLSPAVSPFLPEPFEERGGRQYTFFFWNPAETTLRPR